uniref:family 20 glycosylhydrolase n=1 Tax=[Ruminococcus] torques TaxID=33039 RepID=UPI00402A6F91
MKKKVVSCLLAAAMVVSSGAVVPGFFFMPEKVQAEENDTKAEKENLALKGTAAASEAEADSTSAAKAIDGNKGTHWGTSQNKVTNEWIEVTLEKPTKVSEIKVFWERTGAAGNHQNNIKQWKVDVKTMSGEYKNVHQKTDEGTYAPSEQTITLAEDAQEVVTAVKITVNKADKGPDNFWSNIGLSEIEIYGEESDIEAAENKNHVNAAGVTAEASTTEASSLPVSNIKDGNNQTRWASDYSEASKQTVTVTFPKVTLVKELDFDLHTRDVAPMPSNVKSFDLVYTDAQGTEHTVKISNAKSTESGKTGYVTDMRHIFETPVYMKSFKMTNFDLQIDIEGQNGYNNISILEVRAYSNDQSETPQGQTLDEVVASIKGTKIAKDVNEFTLPNVPDGFTIESNGADFEQIIGEADKETGKLPVVHPMTDKEVQISFNVTETKTGNVKNTGDLAFTVEGTKDTTKAKNAKPSVIPEIQEWFSESDQKVSVDTLTEVTYSDDSLKAIVDEFVSDYKDFTGKELKAGKSSEGKANAFNFKKAAPDELLGDEGYTMDIKSDRIDVQSVSVTGNMYGMQTILQMYKGSEGGFSIGTMRDYPRYETRGFLLDVARKPVSLEMMKEITRTMRYYKMNDFQAHLSDNYIWLGEYGKNGTENNAFNAYEAFRLESGLTNEAGESPTAKDYSITKEQFKKFIADERAVGMNIVPEIDVPAHALSFTKIWPELKVSNKLHNNNPLIDHFDLTNDAAVTKIKEIFDDYTKGTNPTFDADTVVHIGADEFMADAKSYREFVNEIIPYVDKTNTVRMWGGLTQIKDNPPTEINKDAIDGVQINLWSKDWADGIDMYNMGYDLINTIDDHGYLVPDGSLTRKNAYGDLLDIGRIFKDFKVNNVRTKNGAYKAVPSGDDQMLGAAFALWSDNIDRKASGLSESDLYWRFFDAMPFYAEKTWAATGQEKGTSAKLTALAEKMGTGPNTNPYYQEEKKGEEYEKYEFADMKDSSENKRDLKEGKGAEVKDGVLNLGDEESYVTTPIEQLGNGNAISFDLELNKPSKPGDILFEADPAYGTHDIRVMENGKLGFTRELYDYYFDYELPVGKKVNLKIVSTQQKTELFADGRSVGTAVGKFVHNGQVKKEGIKNATFALPIERIGSKTNALAGKIDNVVVSAVNTEDKYNKKDWTITTDSEYSNNSATEGEVTKAFDGKADTKWHSEWQAGAGETNGRLHDGAPTGQGTVDTIFAQAKFDKGYEIDRIAFTPRQDQPSGYVTKADLYIQTEKDGEMKKVVTDAQFAADKTQKVFRFAKQTVYGFKFVAKASNDGWVAVSEFNVGDEIQVVESGKNTIFVNAEKGGKAEIVGAEAGKPFEVDKGAKVTVKATPDKDYHFVGWYHSSNAETPVSTDAEYEFTVSGNYALTAKFEKDNVTPPVETKDVTSIDKPEKVTVEEGTTFEDLKKDLPKTVTVHFGEGEKAETADVEVTWEKGEYKGEAEKTYTLSGTLGKLPENVTNTKNLKAEIEVEVTKKEVTPPVETKDVISVEKPEKVTVEEGTTFEDLKKDLPKIVTVHFGEGEKAETADVEVTWEKGEYKGEAEKTYTLSGTLGKLPENVTNTKNLKAEIKVEVTKKEVTPPVEKEEYTITVSVNDSKMGTVKLNPEKDSYKEGDVVTATAAAKEGYKFVNWTVDGKAVSDKAEFTFKVDRTLTLKANFEKAAENPNQEDPKDDDKAVQTGDTAGSPIVPIAGLALAAGAVMAAVRKKED